MTYAGRRAPSFTLLAVLAALTTLAGCGQSTSPLETPPLAEPRLFMVAVWPDGTLLPVGDTVRMRAATVPPGPATWEWSVVPSGFGAIDQDGLLRGLVSGSFDVRACTLAPRRVCGTAPIDVR